MRADISRETAEMRVVKRYRKLYKPLVELIQSLQDLESNGIQVAEVEISRDKGEIVIQYTAKATRLIINDDGKRFIMQIEKA